MHMCKHCNEAAPTVREDQYIYCSSCGKVLDQDVYSTEVTFYKGSGGQNYASGTRVKSVEGEFSQSYENTLSKGRDEIIDMVESLGISGGEYVINQACGFYRITVARNFTRGHSRSHVAAACLYVTCRENKRPYLLIDFSEYLSLNVYVLGAVFLKLCRLLRLEQHPIFQKPVDPSLFIHRFTEQLLGGKNTEVSRTALRILASMKRDWMQTGRKPSGICGAALYISALSFGHRYSKSDIVKVVHICEATLGKRLIEFENTESGSLTIEEFNLKADEFEREVGQRRRVNVEDISSEAMELLCEHKGTGRPHVAHGLCKACYDDFIALSGGLEGGSEPPAFQRAERDGMAKREAQEERAKESCVFEKQVECSSGTSEDVTESEKLDPRSSVSSIGAVTRKSVDNDDYDYNSCEQSHLSEDMEDTPAGDESENLSDIDDLEVAGYLNNEEETQYKRTLWEEMNKEYLEEQEAKEAAAAYMRKAFEDKYQNCPEKLSILELAEAAKATVAKSRKERRQKRAAEAKNMPTTQNISEVVRRELTRKRLSSKINFDILPSLFESTFSETTKRARSESNASNNHGAWDDNTDDAFKDEDYGEEVDDVITYGGGDDSYYRDEDEGYGYDEDCIY